MVGLMKNKSFLRSGEGTTASISFTEAASGQGIVSLQGISTDTGVTTAYILTSNADKSNNTTSTGASTFDLDFDLPILKTLTLSGKGIYIVKYGESGGGSGANTTIYLIIKLRKVHNGVESDIVSVQTPNTVGVTNRDVTKVMSITIPKTTYNVGDTLRITVEGYGGGGGTRAVTLWHDPDTAGDEFKQYLPIKVEI